MKKHSSRSAVTIIDYGMGNLESVRKAFLFLGAKVSVTASPSGIHRASSLVLPGVGAFGDAMTELRRRGLIEAMHDSLGKGKKMLGICLGQQLLFEKSEESPQKKGLSIIPGEVKLLKKTGVKIPQMGWNSLVEIGPHPVLRGISEEDYFYFVHSFYVKPVKVKDSAALCNYGKNRFAAVVAKDNVVATQFHPEKSQKPGLKLLNNFLKWSVK